MYSEDRHCCGFFYAYLAGLYLTDITHSTVHGRGSMCRKVTTLMVLPVSLSSIPHNYTTTVDAKNVKRYLKRKIYN